MTRTLVACVLLVAMGTTMAESASDGPPNTILVLDGELTSSRFSVRVVDGDTLELKSAGVGSAKAQLEAIELNGKRIRLEGIDAPESDQDCETVTGERYACGQAATAMLRELVFKAEDIRCEVSGTDRYGRLLAICHALEEDLNGLLVSQGLVVAYRRYSHVYAPLEDEAKAAKRGVWAGRFVMPWDYRRCLVRCQGNRKACSDLCWQSKEGGDHD